MRLIDCPRQDPRSIGAKTRRRQGSPAKSCARQSPTDARWRQRAASSSGSAFQTKCLVYKMSTIHMRWRLASSTMLHVNPTVRGQHPRLLERRPGSPPLSSRWSSTNVEIAYCHLGQLITGQLGFGGGVCHHRMPPRSGRETSARTSRALSVHQNIRTPYDHVLSGYTCTLHAKSSPRANKGTRVRRANVRPWKGSRTSGESPTRLPR